MNLKANYLTSAALVIGLAIVPSDWKIFGYYALDELKDGFSITRAIRDSCFAMAASDMGSFKTFTNLHSSAAEAVMETDDHITAICKTSIYLKTTEVPVEWRVLDTADPVATSDRLKAYVDACRETFATLPAEGRQRALLYSYHPPLGVPRERVNITSPINHGPYDLAPYLKLRKLRDEAAAAKPSLAPRHQPVEKAEPSWVRPSLAKNAELGVQAVEPVVVPGSEVAQAIYEGRVVQFDATELLPRELFNLSMVDIAEMHGNLADQIPVYTQPGATNKFGWTSLRDAGRRIDLLRKADKLYYASTVPVPREPHRVPRAPSANASRELEFELLTEAFTGDLASSVSKLKNEVSSLPEGASLKALHEGVARELGMSSDELSGQLHNMRRWQAQTTTNVRRLPKLPPVDLKKAMGDPHWMERSWSMLWTGAVGSWWHNDEPDNLLIAMNRETTVAVFEMNDTDFISGLRGPFTPFFDLGDFHPDKVHPKWLEDNPWVKKFPYIRVHLKPGMGVTVPSRTYHSIWTQDSDRILLNAFMLPKYGALEKAPRPANSFYSPGMQSDLYMALLHLKMSSIGRLWDTRQLGGFFEVSKLEIL